MRGLLAVLAVAGGWASSVTAQVPSAEAALRVQTPAEALARDAVEYARRYGVELPEAIRRLAAQEASVAETDRVAALYRDRLAGISIEHFPDFRIVVLLTGDAPVRDRTIDAGGMRVPLLFRTGAAATRARIVDAIVRHGAAIRTIATGAQGMGVDARTGELVLLVRPGLDEAERDALAADIAALTEVPVRVAEQDARAFDLQGSGPDITEASDTKSIIVGGGRVYGIDPVDGKRYACTTGFVVTDASRTGVVTAAHCPDALTYPAPGGDVPLDFVGQWGVSFQDVQVHVSDRARRPLFHADARAGAVRALTGARRLASTRAGDVVCHRGVSSGYSCSEVDLLDYSPPGDLCAGPCAPSWVTVDGPSCRGGDSGGPVFMGTTAFGIVKGGSYRGARCAFYYYMSTDYLPEGWSLVRAQAVGAPKQ